MATNNGKRGGLLVGETDKNNGAGIPATVQSDGRNVLLGGGEKIIVEDAKDQVHTFDGKKKTSIEIQSALNVEAGGVPIPSGIEGNTSKFDDGGKVGDDSDYKKYIEPKLSILPKPNLFEVIAYSTSNSDWIDTNLELAINRPCDSTTKVFIINKSELKEVSAAHSEQGIYRLNNKMNGGGKVGKMMYGGSIEYYGNIISDDGYKWIKETKKIYSILLDSGIGVPLNSIISHKELFKKYPLIKNVRVYFESIKDETLDADSHVWHSTHNYSLSAIHIKLHSKYYKKYGKEKFELGNEYSEYSKEASLLHEIQHICQQADRKSTGRSHEAILMEFMRTRQDLGHIDRIELVAFYEYKLQPSEQEAMKTVFYWLEDKGIKYTNGRYINWNKNTEQEDSQEGIYEDGGRITVKDRKKMDNPIKTYVQYKSVVLETVGNNNYLRFNQDSWKLTDDQLCDLLIEIEPYDNFYTAANYLVKINKDKYEKVTIDKMEDGGMVGNRTLSQEDIDRDIFESQFGRK